MGPAVFVLQESVSCGMKHLCLGPTWGGRGSLPQERGQTGKWCIARMAKIRGGDIQKTQYLLKKYHFSIANALYRRHEIVKNMQKNTIYV